MEDSVCADGETRSKIPGREYDEYLTGNAYEKVNGLNGLKDQVSLGNQEVALKAAKQIEEIRSSACSYAACTEGDSARFVYDENGEFVGVKTTL
ncbi:hypothetical protein, partial [Paenibacillus sp. SI8]|uniref:hypothetical protein n=1 Tax=unclassified Paenibacillus TaxID=185978 RepID=UPI003467802A